MASCCKRPTGVTPRQQAQLAAKFKEVTQLFPGTSVVLLIRQDGDLVWQMENGTKQQRTELNTLISNLKRASRQFGDALGQAESPVIHVQGGSQLFSCYDVGSRHLLAFMTVVQVSAPELFDTTEKDSAMQTVVDDLRLIVEPPVM